MNDDSRTVNVGEAGIIFPVSSDPEAEEQRMIARLIINNPVDVTPVNVPPNVIFAAAVSLYIQHNPELVLQWFIDHPALVKEAFGFDVSNVVVPTCRTHH